MATKKCPLCAEEIQAEAVICRYCGARFEVTRRGYCPACRAVVAAGEGSTCAQCGGPLADEFLDSRPITAAPPPPPAPVPPAAVGAPPAPAAAAPQGEVTEAIVPSGRQLFGYYLEAIVILAALMATALGFVGDSLVWGRQPMGWARPAPLFIIGIIIILITWSIGVRELGPRLRQGKLLESGRRFRATLKDRFGTSRLLRRRGMLVGIVVAVLLWLLLELVAVYNYNDLTDKGWTIEAGMYAALALPALGALAALLVLGRGRKVVRLDSAGAIYE